MIRGLAGWLLVASLVAPAAQAQIASSVGAFAERYLTARIVSNAPAITQPEAAQAFQDRLVELLERRLGPPVGYKAALTGAAAQARFGVQQPVLGVLLRDMLLNDKATVPVGYAARPVVEADLLVEIGDASISTATNRAEALAALAGVHPFIELADAIYAPELPLTVPLVVCANAGARAGVVADPIERVGDTNLLERLASFTVDVTDGRGASLGRGEGRDLMGHPLDVVLWIRDELRAQGKSLKPGDLLSLGALAPPVEARPGGTVQVIYYGLDPRGPVSVQANFRP